MQFGYHSEDLRTERKRLLEENQRLALEKERTTAPDKLEPAARRLGLKPATAGQIGNAGKASRKDARSIRKTQTRRESDPETELRLGAWQEPFTQLKRASSSRLVTKGNKW